MFSIMHKTIPFPTSTPNLFTTSKFFNATFPGLADFFISQGMGKNSKEYLIKYFTDIYEDKVNILEIVPEDLLLEIPGKIKEIYNMN